jgi:prepilin peptidase CpaA
VGIARQGIWVLAALLGLVAGITDWRSRRIPNWLTVSAAAIGIAANCALGGWTGLRISLLGMGLGLLLLLPFVLVRALGAGDWKLVGAVGALLGPQHLIAVLLASVLVAGIMALGLVIWKRRFLETLRNLGRMLAAFLTLHLPGSEVSLDNPQSLKVPFGVAVAVAVILYAARQALGLAAG